MPAPIPTAMAGGFEKGVSCVVPGSGVAVANLPCQVGGPVPPSGPPAGAAGVAVDGTCFALCNPALTDPDGDGWAYQYDAPCVMPQSSVAAASLKCTIGGNVPVGSFQGSKGRVLTDVCTPFCTTAAADPDGDGFGFQYSTTCVVTGSVPALRGLDCTVGVNPVDPPIMLNQNPPPGQVAKPAAARSRGFFVSGGRIYDKFGNDFVFRGVNNPDIWFDTGDQYLAYSALDNIAALGTNAVRVVWETTGTAALLRRVLRHVVELKMIPIVELHDATGSTDNAQLITLANYYASADVKQVLLDFEEFALLNIANEWSGTDYRNGYTAAITRLRNSGLNHTLVIDANGFGQNATSIFNDGSALLTADPQHNLVFSVHMYDAFSAARGGGQAKITSTLEQAVSAGLPLIVGEFGWQGGSPPVAIDWAFIMSECARLRIGYFPWSWKGNDANLAYLDLSSDWEGARLNTWGMQATQGAAGITQSAHRASIFGP
jgi:mannan endo-1,4-beta-mannosidase